MKITLHDGRTFEKPAESDIATLFAALSDPGDFIILKDELRGEVRAAGPHDGTFLLQCDLPRDGRTFSGERQDVGLAEAVSIFRDFLAGRPQWSSSFADREPPLPRTVKLVLILAGLGAVALLFWYLIRAA